VARSDASRAKPLTGNSLMVVNLLTGLAFLFALFVFFAIGNLFVGLLRRRRKPADHAAGSLMIHVLAGSIPQLASEVEAIGFDLRRGGDYRKDAQVQFLALRNAVIVLTLLLTLTASALSLDDPLLLRMFVVTGSLLAILAYGFPRILLGWRASKRVAQIQDALPECLDMIAMSLTGGVALRDSLNHVAVEARKSNPAIAIELELIGRQATAGSMGQALKHFAERIDVPDVKSLASIISQTEKLGTNVARAMRDYSETVRTSHRRRVEEKANRLTVQIMLPVIFCLSPPVYLLLCGPPVLELVEHFKGRNFTTDAQQSVDNMDETL
jgi:tight adherence protein C